MTRSKGHFWVFDIKMNPFKIEFDMESVFIRKTYLRSWSLGLVAQGGTSLQLFQRQHFKTKIVQPNLMVAIFFASLTPTPKRYPVMSCSKTRDGDPSQNICKS